MHQLIVVFLLVVSTSSFASSLIECEGMGNPNAGLIRIITNENNDSSDKVMVSVFDRGTFSYHLEKVEIDLDTNLVVNHTALSGMRLSVDISNESLSDGATTIRPFFFKSKIYFEVPSQGSIINSHFFKCRIFKDL